jgi:hypothetical protein
LPAAVEEEEEAEAETLRIWRMMVTEESLLLFLLPLLPLLPWDDDTSAAAMYSMCALRAHAAQTPASRARTTSLMYLVSVRRRYWCTHTGEQNVRLGGFTSHAQYLHRTKLLLLRGSPLNFSLFDLPTTRPREARKREVLAASKYDDSLCSAAVVLVMHEEEDTEEFMEEKAKDAGVDATDGARGRGE